MLFSGAEFCKHPGSLDSAMGYQSQELSLGFVCIKLSIETPETPNYTSKSCKFDVQTTPTFMLSGINCWELFAEITESSTPKTARAKKADSHSLLSDSRTHKG